MYVISFVIIFIVIFLRQGLEAVLVNPEGGFLWEYRKDKFFVTDGVVVEIEVVNDSVELCFR